jgi:Protein of unknown function (DUF1549)/Protein of unknown function (DUF1553)
MTALHKTLLTSAALGLAWCVCGPSLKSAPAGTTRDPLPVAARIDREIDRRLSEAKVPASPVSDDAEFIRRLSLDILGRIPSADRTATFLADSDPAKRQKLIDEFLADPAYGEHFGTVWYHRMAKPTMDNRQLLSMKFRDWLAERFNRNDTWDAIVRDILVASGDRDQNPATVFYLAHAEGNGRHEIVPARVNASASYLFLGVKLECCECHDHMFDRTLKQTDFWGMAAFFTATHAENAGKNEDGVPSVREVVPSAAIAERAAKAGAKLKAIGKAAPKAAEKAAKAAEKAAAKAAAAKGAAVIPDTNGKTVQARFLHGESPKLAGKSEYRPVLAKWVTAPENPYFAKAMVNKVWANFFGRGIVNPIDDMRADSPNSHPALLDALAAEFKASGFEVKHLIRCICNSAAYQRGSRPLAENREDEELYSHMKLKVMSADMLYDSLTTVLSREPATQGRFAAKAKAKAKAGPRTPREEFRSFFHAEADDDSGVVEDYTHGIPQVLRLMNSQSLSDTKAVVAKLAKANETPETVIEALYLRVLSRRPTAEESERMVKYVAAGDAAKGYGDALWVLINSSEFLFNH